MRANHKELYRKIRDYIEDRPNTAMDITTIRRGAGSADQHAVSGILGVMAKTEGHGVVRVQRGVYLFDPAKKSTNPPALYTRYKKTPAASNGSLNERDLLEVLRVRVDGDIVLMDASGELYVAKHVVV